MVAGGLVQDEATPFIHEACQQSRPVSLAVPNNNAWGLCRARLLSFDPGTSRLIITHPESAQGKDSVPMVQGTELGVRFIAEDRRVMFMAGMYGFACYFEDAEPREAVELEIASNVICSNQRQHCRIAIPEDRLLTMVLHDTSIAQHPSETEQPPAIYRGMVRDLSVGGAFIGGLKANPQWKRDDHLKVELQVPGKEPLILIAKIRRVAKEPDDTLSYGLAFIGTESNDKAPDTQEVLSGIVTDLQHSIERISDEP